MNVQEEEIFRGIRGTEVLEVHNSNPSVPLKPLPLKSLQFAINPKITIATIKVKTILNICADKNAFSD